MLRTALLTLCLVSLVASVGLAQAPPPSDPVGRSSVLLNDALKVVQTEAGTRGAATDAAVWAQGPLPDLDTTAVQDLAGELDSAIQVLSDPDPSAIEVVGAWRLLRQRARDSRSVRDLLGDYEPGLQAKATPAAKKAVAEDADYQRAAKDEADAQTPQPIGIRLDAGHLLNLREGGDDDSYCKLTYDGLPIIDKGVPFQYAKHPNMDTPEAWGDRSAFNLRLGNGILEAGGDLLSLDFVPKPKSVDLTRLGLRGTAFLGTPDFDTWKLAVGLETKPMHFASKTVTNSLMLGLSAQRTFGGDTDPDAEDTGLVTYRAFIGRGFGWRAKRDKETTEKELAAALFRELMTPRKAGGVGLVDGGADGSPPKAPISFLRDWMSHQGEPNWLDSDGPLRDEREAAMAALVPLNDSLGEGLRKSQGAAEIAIQNDYILDQATLAIYAESSGWYDFTGDVDGGRFKGLLTANVDWWPLQTDNVCVRLRYENGWDRAAPDERLDRLMLSTTLNY